MITKIAERAADMLYKTEVIPKEDRELYTYGFFLLFSYLLFFLVIFVLGSITGTLGEGILFYMQFLLLRGYAGGIHASKETTCILCTTVMLTLSILLLRAITVMKMSVIPLGILLFCGMVVYFMSPLETIEKPLTKEERYHFGRMTSLKQRND